MGYMTFAKSPMTDEEAMNFWSHHIAIVDDCYRCYFCEIGVWNAHKEACR